MLILANINNRKVLFICKYLHSFLCIVILAVKLKVLVLVESLTKAADCLYFVNRAKNFWWIQWSLYLYYLILYSPILSYTKIYRINPNMMMICKGLVWRNDNRKILWFWVIWKYCIYILNKMYVGNTKLCLAKFLKPPISV
jgi:hypothetical protein